MHLSILEKIFAQLTCDAYLTNSDLEGSTYDEMSEFFLNFLDEKKQSEFSIDFNQFQTLK